MVGVIRGLRSRAEAIVWAEVRAEIRAEIRAEGRG